MSRRLKIVLASSSPRRRRLMEQLGITFEVVDPGDVDETISGDPEDAVRRNALSKALKVARGVGEGLVVSADTIVVLDDGILGKPSSASEAEEMLRTLRGSVHRVLTGLAVVEAGSGRVETDVVETLVRMLEFSDEDLEAYVATGEPLGKAGGYAIQGLGAVLVADVRGCFYNVVGLPLSRLNTIIKEFGVHALDKCP